MGRIATLVAACLAIAAMGAAMAVASSGKGPGNRPADDSITNTTGTTTTPGDGNGRRRGLEGRVVAINTEAKTFDLRVRRHHRRGGKTVTITVTDATTYKNLPDGFASIALRNKLKVKASKVDGVLVASKVALKRPKGGSDDRSGSNSGSGSN